MKKNWVLYFNDNCMCVEYKELTLDNMVELMEYELKQYMTATEDDIKQVIEIHNRITKEALCTTKSY